MNARDRLPIAGAIVATAITGYLLAAATTAETPAPDTPTAPVSVGIIYDRHGEVVDVDLTDENGGWIPTGTIAESRPDDSTDTDD
ncbi:hypothetical protein ACTXM8_10355 [Brachybacterium alimentarium]|uniref:hypothetical protein n=1 Tax=Brachybacterium alimentarium TaxID=47845 RepID=UPI003FD2CD7A